MGVWKSLPGRGNRECKCLKAGLHLSNSRPSKEASVAEAEGMRGRMEDIGISENR